MNFPEVWVEVSGRLQPGERVRNWTAAKGFLGDDFTVVRIGSSHVDVDAPDADTIQRVPRKDFEVMFDHWAAYCSGQMKRQALVKLTRVSKYTMSIFRHLDIQAAARAQ